MTEVIERQSKELKDTISNEEDPLLVYLLSTKLRSNIQSLRLQTNSINNIKSYSNNDEQNVISNLEFDALLAQRDAFLTIKDEYHQYQESSKRQRVSVDLDQVQTSETEKNNEIELIDEKNNEFDDEEDLVDLRQRLLGKLSNEQNIDTDKSAEKQIENNENMQQSLIEDMSQLARTLKEGASAFQNALDEDKNVLGAAEMGVLAASKNITNMSGRLKKYDKSKLSYLFYIGVALFMFFGLIITFMIIKLFPAL